MGGIKVEWQLLGLKLGNKVVSVYILSILLCRMVRDRVRYACFQNMKKEVNYAIWIRRNMHKCVSMNQMEAMRVLFVRHGIYELKRLRIENGVLL